LLSIFLITISDISVSKIKIEKQKNKIARCLFYIYSLQTVAIIVTYTLIKLTSHYHDDVAISEFDVMKTRHVGIIYMTWI